MAKHPRTRREALDAFVAQFPTQKAAAQALGIAGPTLTDILRGRRSITERVLAKMGYSVTERLSRTEVSRAE